MIQLRRSVCRVLLLSSIARASAAGQAQGGVVFIRDVNVVDGIVATARPHRDVLVRDGVIVWVHDATARTPPRGAAILDGAGKFLIPGLWDMHTHSGGYEAARASYPTLLRHGIVGVRDMGTPLDDMLRIRDSLRSGAFSGPRLSFCGPLIQGPLPFSNPLLLQVNDSASVATAVDSLRRAGVNCLKVHDALSARSWRDVVREGRRAGLPVVGHLPPEVPARDATAAGQRSIEHLGGRFMGVLLGMADDEDPLRRAETGLVESIMDAMRRGQAFDDMAIYRAPFIDSLLKSQSRSRRRELIAAFRRNDTWQTPTLVALPIRSLLARTDTSIAPRDRVAGERLLRTIDTVVFEMWRSGVPLLVGTDSPLRESRLVDEMSLLVHAGIPPAAVLKLATLNAARFLGRTTAGSIAPGKDGDLVLLAANPLLDIRNVGRVEAVIFKGRILVP
jgi:hypothetical protein